MEIKEGAGFVESRVESNSCMPLKDFSIPVRAFSADGLSSLHIIVKYLKEEQGIRHSEIAKILNRDQRTIWDAYSSSKLKASGALIIPESEIFVPVSIFFERHLSILESLTVYLKEQYGLRYSQIAKLISKDQRTIWTVYQRGQRKLKRIGRAK